MTIEDDIAFLERVPILRRLGGGALRILAIGAESYSVEAGQVLFAAGDTADCAYIVQRRLVRRSTPTRRARARSSSDRALCWARPALLAETLRPATATARERSTVVRISRTMFLKMLESYPEAAQRLRDLIAARAEQWARDMDKSAPCWRAGLGREIDGSKPPASPSPARGRTAAPRRGNSWRWRCRRRGRQAACEVQT